jgi:hypothetical protein
MFFIKILTTFTQKLSSLLRSFKRTTPEQARHASGFAKQLFIYFCYVWVSIAYIWTQPTQEDYEMGATSFQAVTGIDIAGRARGSVTCSNRETAAGINLDSAGLYSEILKRHAATQEHPNISILLPAAECGS